MTGKNTKQLKAIRTFSRRRIIFIVVIAIGLLLLLYTLLSVSAWAKQEETLRTVHKDAKAASEQLQSAKSRLAQREAIAGLDAVSEKSDQLCQVAWWYAWQQRLGKQQMIQDCEATKQTLAAIQMNTQKLLAFDKAEVALATALTPIAIDMEQLTEANWQKAIDGVKKADAQVHQIFAPESFMPVHRYALKTTSEMRENWDRLIKAHKAKNRENFEASVDSLDSSYQQLKTLTERSNSERKVLVTQLIRKTEKL